MPVPIPVDPNFDVLVVIPTVGKPSVLVPTVTRIARHTDGLRVLLVLAVNPADPDAADAAVAECRKICAGKVDLLVQREPGPIGFGAANNRGVALALDKFGGLPELVVFHNDDAHVAAGWLVRMLAAIRSDVIHGYSEPWDVRTGLRKDRRRADYGRVGLVGPVSNLVAGIQLVTAVLHEDGTSTEWPRGGPDGFARLVGDRYDQQCITADFLSGFCVGISREALEDLALVRTDAGVVQASDCDPLPGSPGYAPILDGPANPAARGWLGPWDEDRYPIAGYEDNDLCVRAELAGWRPVVAADCFVAHVGHQTFDELFPEAQRGLRNRQAYYDRWRGLTRPDRGLVVAGAWRLRFEVGQDIGMMRASLGRAASFVDRVAIVLNGNPLDVRDDLRWKIEEGLLHPDDKALLLACSGADAPAVEAAVKAWAVGICAAAERTRILVPGQVVVELWAGDFDERAERNRTAEISESMGADWILSIDGDEVLENRLERKHLERCIRHPDPLVRSFDQSWLNHWDSSRIVREDPPWGDGGKYVGGMHGFRLWRIPRREDGTLHPMAPRRIIAGTDNGLHCGNSPDHDLTAKRVSGIRFRHFGYVREPDRRRKHARYQEQDPNADAMLTGNTGRDPYGHLLAEEGMRVSPYVQVNGIGLHVLVYAGEQPSELARLLDAYVGVVDRVVLVWTGTWRDQDKGWLMPEDPEQAARRDDRDTQIAMSAPTRISGATAPASIRVARRGAPHALSDFAWMTQTGPSLAFAKVAEAFGAEWVHKELDDDLGAARNAGIDALLADARGIGWSLFCDLDEHLPDQFPDLVAVRRMAEVSDCWGWLWRFQNFHRGTGPSMSESIRMARLLPGVRLTGRVHETFDAAFERAQAELGIDVAVRVAPFVVNHFGLALEDGALDRKLRRYQRMLLLELEDRPLNSAAWVALGLQQLNDGHEAKGLECLERAVACGDRGYLGFRELAMHHLRVGTALLGESVRRVPRGHDWHRAMAPIHRTLAQAIPPMPVLGSAQGGTPACPPIDLPPFVPAEDVASEFEAPPTLVPVDPEAPAAAAG